uniref:Uncharacterized protein n=1 Tax=Anser brachyrhynchus TaxID=132585 RepID=A0A8B9BCI7_9AVES
MSCPTEEVRQYWVLLAPVLTSATRASRSSSPRTVCECMKTSSSWAQGLHNISACSCHSGFPGHPCTHPSLVLTSKGKRKEGFISSHFSVFVYNPNELFDSFHVGQAHFPRAGLFRCVETDLEFLVRTATSIEYKYSFWERHLASGIPPVWMEVGPVFDIHAPPATVKAIHIPHFLCLGGTVQNTSWMQIAHIVDGNLLLEKPTRVKSFHAVLEDPSFSPMGVILLSDKLPFIPVHSLVLLYRVFSAADITFHLYLIPNHRGLEKVSVPLILFTQVWWFPGCTPRSPVLNNSVLELNFVYLASDRRQLFTEIYTKDMEEGMQLTLTKVVQEGKRDCRLLWGTLLRAGRESGMQVYKHREQLIQRVTSVSRILDQLLQYSVLTDEQYETIRAKSTRQEQMRRLYSFMPSWNTTCKDHFLDALKETSPYLIQELQGS